jgi:hypothetical protein
MIAFSPVGKPDEAWLKHLVTGEERPICRGTMPKFSPDGRFLPVVRQSTPGKWELDREIWLVDVGNGKGRRVGLGHSPCFLPSGLQIVFLQGYTRRVFVSRVSDGKTNELDSTATHKTQPQICLDGSGCLIRMASDGRLGEIYLLDEEQETFTEIAALE